MSRIISENTQRNNGFNRGFFNLKKYTTEQVISIFFWTPILSTYVILSDEIVIHQWRNLSSKIILKKLEKMANLFPRRSQVI